MVAMAEERVVEETAEQRVAKTVLVARAAMEWVAVARVPVTKARVEVEKVAVTVGVPAWRYQRSNCVRSRPDASAIALRKSSHVTACPSWRWK